MAWNQQNEMGYNVSKSIVMLKWTYVVSTLVGGEEGGYMVILNITAYLGIWEDSNAFKSLDYTIYSHRTRRLSCITPGGIIIRRISKFQKVMNHTYLIMKPIETSVQKFRFIVRISRQVIVRYPDNRGTWYRREKGGIIVDWGWKGGPGVPKAPKWWKHVYLCPIHS